MRAHRHHLVLIQKLRDAAGVRLIAMVPEGDKITPPARAVREDRSRRASVPNIRTAAANVAVLGGGKPKNGSPTLQLPRCGACAHSKGRPVLPGRPSALRFNMSLRFSSQKLRSQLHHRFRDAVDANSESQTTIKFGRSGPPSNFSGKRGRPAVPRS